jgi:hypothetical protein
VNIVHINNVPKFLEEHPNMVLMAYSNEVLRRLMFVLEQHGYTWRSGRLPTWAIMNAPLGVRVQHRTIYSSDAEYYEEKYDADRLVRVVL